VELICRLQKQQRPTADDQAREAGDMSAVYCGGG
jgi:hypothetical protein